MSWIKQLALDGRWMDILKHQTGGKYLQLNGWLAIEWWGCNGGKLEIRLKLSLTASPILYERQQKWWNNTKQSIWNENKQSSPWHIKNLMQTTACPPLDSVWPYCPSTCHFFRIKIHAIMNKRSHELWHQRFQNYEKRRTFGRRDHQLVARGCCVSGALVTRVTGGAMWVAGASFSPHTVPLNHGAAYIHLPP